MLHVAYQVSHQVRKEAVPSPTPFFADMSSLTELKLTSGIQLWSRWCSPLVICKDFFFILHLKQHNIKQLSGRQLNTFVFFPNQKEKDTVKKKKKNTQTFKFKCFKSIWYSWMLFKFSYYRLYDLLFNLISNITLYEN